MNANAATYAEDRRTGKTLQSPAKLNRQLKGDLDNIILRALRKEPERRYVSAEQLAEDIRRHLQGLPVTAMADSVVYRIKKFLHRHQVGVAAATLVFVVLAGGIITTVREARIAEANRRRAETRFNDVRKLANSLIFEIHDSIADLPGATKARQLILQRALEYLDSLTKESGNEPDLLRELANAYGRIGAVQGSPMEGNLGDTKAAATSLQKSLELRELLARSNPKNRDDQTALASAYLGYSEFQTGAAGNIASGFDYASKAIAILDPEVAVDPNNLRINTEDISGHYDRALIQIGNGAEGSVGTIAGAIADLQQALVLDQRAIEANPSNLSLRSKAAAMTGILGDCALKLGDRPRALDNYHRSLDILTALSAQQSNIRFAGNALVMTQHIGDALLIEGKVTEAVNWYAKSHEMAAQMSSNDPNNDVFQRLLITTSAQLGHALVENGQVEEGMKYLNFARVKLEASPSQIPLIAVYKGILHQWIGEVSERKGKINDAASEYSTSQKILHPVLAGGANDLRNQVFYVSSTDRLGAAMLKLGNATEAQKQYEDSRRILEPLNRSNPDNMEVLYALAETYAGEGSVFAKLAQGKVVDRNQSLANWNSASEWFQKSLNVWSKVPHPSRFSTSWMEVRMPNEVARQLTECRAQIAHVASHSPDSSPKV